MTDNTPQQDRGGPKAEFEEVREALETLFVSGDPAEAFETVSPAEVQAFLRRSERARAYFDRLAVSDRALEGGLEALPTNGRGQDALTTNDGGLEALPTMGEQDALPTNGRGQDALTTNDQGRDALATSGDFEQTFGEAAFTSALDDMLAEERADDADPDETSDDTSADVLPLFGGRSRAIGLAVAAMAALGLGIVLMNGGPSGSQNGADSSSSDDGFQARSAVSPDRSRLRAPQLEVFCVHRSADGVRFEGRRNEPLEALDCPVDAELKLAFRNREQKLTHAAFFGVDTSGNLYWYGPTPADQGPKRVESGPEMKPFGETIRLGVNHRPGRTRVHAVFATEPIDFGTLERQLESRRPGGLFERESIDLRGFQTASASRIIEIADASDGSEQ